MSSADAIAPTFKTPYYAVIFTSLQSDATDGYAETAQRMMELAAQQPGYLGVEHARGDEGVGITVSYWQTEADITAWRDHAEHQIAQQRGRSEWYASFALRIARVESDRVMKPSSNS